MVNARVASCAAVLLLAALVLTGAAAMRSAEYDEQYTLFLTAGVGRPAWPDGVFPAGRVAALQARGPAGLAAIARDLRATDVHPPLYFWAAALWRRGAGPSLFAARMLPVLCSLAALAMVGGIAAAAGIPPAPAMLLTLGCYGFTYTGAIARGFALAQLLTLVGVLLLLRGERRPGAGFAAGLLLGAAAATNYLAAFVGVAVLAQRGWGRGSARAWTRASAAAWIGFAAWMPLDLFFFLAQRGSRSGQFPPFHPVAAMHRLAIDGAATLFGGLPLYVTAELRPLVSGGLAGVLLGLAGLATWRWRRLATPRSRAVLATAAVAPPLGLLLLGLAFDATPIEVRYLAFAAPFAALLLAGTLASLPRRAGYPLLAMVLGIQATALTGLLIRPETMQPARATAQAAVRLAGDGLVLVPRGNDGVGIVGAFGIEAPPGLDLLAIGADTPLVRIRHALAGRSRLVLALLAQDAASRTALPLMRAAVGGRCWRPAASGFNVAAFERVCDGE